MGAVFQHLTVPVDGSPPSERGVAFALELARGGGGVTFCSVVDPTLVCLPVAYGEAADPAPMLETLEADAREFCRRAALEAAGQGVVAEARVLHGRCVDAIEALVRENASEAIVVGTHGRSGFARTLLGSVAEGLIRRSDVPVISVHEDDVMRTGPIVVALDGSPAAHAALGIAIDIAATRGITIALIYMCDAKPDPSAGNEFVTDAAIRVRGRGVGAQIVVREGRAAELLGAADQLESCMIVMGIHGRPFFARLALGSVTTHVVQHARIPVVTVKAFDPVMMLN